MAVPVFHDHRVATLPCSVDKLSVTLTVLVYATSLIVEAVRHGDKTDSKLMSSTKLRGCQLHLCGIILVLSIAHSILLARPISFTEQDSTELFDALLWSLVWSILLFRLVHTKTDADVSLCRASTVASILEIAALLRIMIGLDTQRPSLVALVDIVRIVRGLALIGLSNVTFLATRSASITEPDVSAGKTNMLNSDRGSEARTAADNTRSHRHEQVEQKLLSSLSSRLLGKYASFFTMLLPHLRPQTRSQCADLVVVGLCSVLTTVQQVLLPLSLGHLVRGLEVAQEGVPWPRVVAYLGLRLLSQAGIIDWMASGATLRLEAMMHRSLHRFCYDHVMNLSADFHEAENSDEVGQIIERGGATVDLVLNTCSKLVPQMLDLSTSIFMLVYVFERYVGFVTAITMLLFVYASTKSVGQKSEVRRHWGNAMMTQRQHLCDTHAGWMTVSQFNNLQHEQVAYGQKTDTAIGVAMAIASSDIQAQLQTQLIAYLGFVVVMLIAMSEIGSRRDDLSAFVVLVTNWGHVVGLVTGLIHQMNETSAQLVDVERLLVLLGRTPTIRSSSDATAINFHGGAVDFENVTFSYDGDRNVVKDVSFSVKAGQTVAIVGETGGGKSTLLKLLFRLYDPTQGRIQIDGHDLRDLTVESVRDLMGVVPQDLYLFQRSISENVRYANMAASDEDVVAACQAAAIHDQIMAMTNGYQQELGSRGAGLSGGQRQRLAIARCILKTPKMLLLDEATGSVDSMTEAKIQQGLKQLCKDRTTFIVTHRLATALHADQILVMQNGTIVEAGSHRTLVEQGGVYQQLWDAQSSPPT